MTPKKVGVWILQIDSLNVGTTTKLRSVRNMKWELIILENSFSPNSR
ncbi:hypothetical protein LEP1GSC116_3881 [Leptospira interrogans serovar Icterohaemorrhagiae str. Verdun HP]|uniref:Uncharacterized protein n=3 Tax=Leptospira interrogans TaxID=173 RepID=M6RRC2_LEPIR|nr:hypothetical protein G436_1465 [Leptospira interrogans serovar Hardjo str. Norma]EKO89829.1 hypothetical protein LEP1GSC009_1172 [Leptospira interrogans serovar Grippotyphosa str. Andaman]EMG24263.1 hypothetical protein LEP1GSC150_2398 [Leptospira interrogans serovar Copenhageni str. LT2050]EMO07074.1 hypothetical protein LEP1GSC116_3881 [Leptospira interrogans serovar Icterohaemorrhagiae str. Verdun HP]